MPRERTLKPVALATIVCSQADLGTVGETRHHRGILLPPLRKSLLSGRVAIRVLKPLDVADDARDQTEPLDPAVEIHLDARLIAVAGGKNDAVLLGIDLQDRPDGRVDFGIHQHDVLAVLEGLEHDMRTELDRSGHVTDHVDEP